MEGALKLKEISYIHAEAYPAGDAVTGRSDVDGDLVLADDVGGPQHLLPGTEQKGGVVQLA